MIVYFSRAIELFNEEHGTTLEEQTLKLGEELGEVNEAVLGYQGRLLFKDEKTADDVGDGLADLIVTAYYVGDLAGVDDLIDRVHERALLNLEREDGGRP